VLAAHPDVVDCAVIGTPDPERGAIVTAFVTLRAGVSAGPATVQALQEHSKAAAAPYKYPRQIEFVDELPHTPTGKLQRHLLRQQVEAKGPAATN